MRIVYITAGAAGMYCGSCMHDNTLVAALRAQGHDALLVPTYTPIRTDEADVSETRVFFGGINVYLQQKFGLFRRTPWFLDRLLDGPRLLRWVSRFAVKTQADQLGDLTISMLEGEHGHQGKEIDKLLTWLVDDIKPDLVHLTNVLLSGMVHRLRERLKVPVLGSLQGDDVFLEMLPAPVREHAIGLISRHCRELSRFVATSRDYADFMAQYLTLPRERIDVIYPGLNLKGQDGVPRPAASPFTIGYFARICPEKGLHHLVDACRVLLESPGLPPWRLHVAGYLGENYRPYLAEQQAKLPSDRLEVFTCPDHASKVSFLKRLDVLSVPTSYREPKGLYVLEAWANGVPVVQPGHGSFPELIAATGGGLLVEPGSPTALARGLAQLMEHDDERLALAQQGHAAVHARFHAEAMARATHELYLRVLA